MKIFETNTDLEREQKAIQHFVNIFKGSFQKLEQFDIDYKVFDFKNNLIAYAEVKGRLRKIKDAYPLPISVLKLVKLSEKKLNPVLIWSCEDGIIYGKINNLEGILKLGGRNPRLGSSHDIELMAYYDKQIELKHLLF
jgi:hypothetical protein